ncbi:cobyric acid synthase [Klebsiella michiganensis]|uniref:Cobyric acid synthase n=1 Tax=Klebsiella michiganensis TaxID=1134687 RepID=A0A7H4PIU3_9ENTR|nr:cobyric acid synthase [Klebsiella michiganensis]
MTLAIMLQGTASDVGKSVLVAGAVPHLLSGRAAHRAVLNRRIWRLIPVSPPDGKEMGRAQIFQAEAAGITPDVRMNPVLLKPTSGPVKRRWC